MQDVVIIGLDLAKSVFQVHGVDRMGEVVTRKMLRRAQVLDFFRKLPSCLVGLEACGSAHHWAREIAAYCGMRTRGQDDPAHLREGLCKAGQD